MAQKMTAPEALVASLKELPSKFRPEKEIFQAQLAAAKRVSSAQEASVIHTLLGTSLDYGSEVPTGPLRFPRDHALHLKAGTEWYWVSCNLEVQGSKGQERIGVLSTINRSRAVSNKVQKEAGWSDAEAQVVDSSATITVATPTEGFIVRRRPNVQWAALGGETRFDAKPFIYQAGPDSMQGTQDVLPLAVRIDDGPEFQIDITLTSDLAPESAFFLQGEKGMTPPPRPGIYYSWPQLAASGTVTARGKKYKVSGTAWIDHQLMMHTAVPRPTGPPAGWEPVGGFDGWSWCQFNLDNGDAFTVAAFQIGSLLTEPPVSYGFYVRRGESGWEPIFLTGALELDRFIPVLEGVLHPTRWTYKVTDAAIRSPLPADLDIELLPTPWYPDGSFVTGNLGVEGETPVNVALIERAQTVVPTGPGTAVTGTGYCETVGYEPPGQYVARALAFLAGAGSGKQLIPFPS
jgi:predicted secreted hydrolase